MTDDPPSRAELLQALAAAIRAPSVHNTQPWLFRLAGSTVEVHADPTRRLPVADPDGRAMRVSCGAAVFNLRLALERAGYVPAVQLTGASEGVLAAVETVGRQSPTSQCMALYEAILRRHSNRYPFLNKPVPLDVRAELIAAASAECGWLDLILGAAGVDMVAQLVRAADRILVADPAYVAEVAAWTRPDYSCVDGVARRAGGPAPEPHDLLATRAFGGPPRTPGYDFEPEPLVGVLGGPSDLPHDDVSVGQSLQRVLLTATRLGLSTSLLSQPIEVASAREQLRLGLHRQGSPHMVLRFGYGVPGRPTPRRSLHHVMLPDAQPVGSVVPGGTGQRH
jgi:nitroreductase